MRKLQHKHILLGAPPVQGLQHLHGQVQQGVVTWRKAGRARAITHWSLTLRGDCSRLQLTTSADG